MTIILDRNIYSDACISKCIYSLSGECECRRTLLDNMERVEVFPYQSSNEEELKMHFMQRLNDNKLREVIAEETKDIRTILYAKAFADSEDFNFENE